MLIKNLYPDHIITYKPISFIYIYSTNNLLVICTVWTNGYIYANEVEISEEFL